jgi:hypothetical protein
MKISAVGEYGELYTVVVYLTKNLLRIRPVKISALNTPNKNIHFEVKIHTATEICKLGPILGQLSTKMKRF